MYKYLFLALENFFFYIISKFIPVHQVSGGARQKTTSMKSANDWPCMSNFGRHSCRKKLPFDALPTLNTGQHLPDFI